LERKLSIKILFTSMEKCKLKTQTKRDTRKSRSKKINITTSHSSLETSLKSIEPIWVHNSKMIFRVSWITKKRILQPSVQLKDLTLEIRLKTQLNLMSVA
jgi:nucleotidyltransferase/DNA polymerase involved in DNA repair